MKKQSSKIILSSLTALVLLSGCGGGGSTDTPPAVSDIDGKAIDGYLQSALVCLDKNNNNDCDSNEPLSITDDTGSYKLVNITAEEKAKYAVLVKAIVGQTKDSDDNGTTISKSFFLKAPASHASVVSPITTLVQNKLENDSTLTLEEAISNIKSSLLVEDTIDIMADYVSKKTSSGTENTEYENLHKFAEVIADSIAESLSDSNITFESENLSLAGTVILDNLTNKVSDIKATVSKDTYDKSELINSSKTTANATKIEEVKLQKELEAKIVKVTDTTTLTKELETGIGNFQFYYYDYTGTTYDQINFYNWTNKLVNNKLEETYNDYDYNTTTNKFDLQVYDNTNSYYYSEDKYYIPNATGWETKTEIYSSDDSMIGHSSSDIIVNSDGSINISYGSSWSDKMTLLGITNLEGISLDSVVRNPYESCYADTSSQSYYKYSSDFIENNTTFGKDTKKYSIKYEFENKYPIRIEKEYCYKDSQNATLSCNDSGYNTFYDYVNNQYISTIEEFKTLYALNSSSYFNWYGDKNYYLQFDENGTVYYFEIGGDYYSSYTYTKLSLTGKLEQKSEQGAIYYEIKHPAIYKYSYTSSCAKSDDVEENTGEWNEIFAVVDGKLRRGSQVTGIYSWRGSYYNPQAISEVKNALESGLKTYFTPSN